MPIFDLSLEELGQYRGTNPRPGDFDEYWDRALADLADQPDNVEFVDAEFQSPVAHCRHLFFSGVDGARVHAQLLTPRSVNGQGPGLLMFHGYSGNSGSWVDKLAYVASGFTVAALDCRGQGGLSEDCGSIRGTTYRGHIVRGLSDTPDRLLFRSIFLDTAQLARIVAGLPEVDGQRLAATGLSQGGALTIACAALYPDIKRAASLFPFLSDYRRVWDMDLADNAYWELREYFRVFDPRHEREEEIFTRLGYIDVHHLASRVQAKVLMGITLMDKVCPPSTQFAVYNNLVCDKGKLVYPDYGHEARMPDVHDRFYEFLVET